MRRLGLIGGTTWHSTVEYYTQLNELVADRLSGSNSADLVLVSLNFEQIVRNNQTDDHAANGRLVLAASKQLKSAGADGLLLCANTMHQYAEMVEVETGLPVIHIADATAAAIQAAGLSKVALLGTKYTMEMDFLRDRLTKHGLVWMIPGDDDRDWIHATIFDELAKGIFTESTRTRYARIIDGLVKQGAEGAILGCTEIPLLIKPGDVAVPTFDTTAIHAQAAINWALHPGGSDPLNWPVQ